MPFSIPHKHGRAYGVCIIILAAVLFLWFAVSFVFQSVETKNEQGFTSKDLEQVQDDVTGLLRVWSGNPQAACPNGLVKRDGGSWLIECTDLVAVLDNYTRGRPDHRAMKHYLTKQWSTPRVMFNYGFTNYIRQNVADELVRIYNEWGNPFS